MLPALNRIKRFLPAIEFAAGAFLIVVGLVLVNDAFLYGRRMVLSVCPDAETLVRFRRSLIAGAAIATLALDQYTKDLVVKHFRSCQAALFNAPCDSRIVIPHFLNWTYERNFHGAFGMFGSSKPFC